MNPLISVILPVYNSELYLAESITSVLAQTFENFELLILDDGSKDKSLEIARSFSDPRIRILHSDQNVGLIFQLNKGIHQSRGEYIARMDADDISLPHRFSKQVAFLNENPSIDICGSGLKTFGDVPGAVWMPPRTHEEISVRMLFDCCLYHPTVFARKKALIDGYSVDFVYAEDYELWTRLISQGYKFANVQEVLLQYRRHRDQIGSRKKPIQELNSDIVRRREMAKLGIFDPLATSWNRILRFGHLSNLKDLSRVFELADECIKLNGVSKLLDEVLLDKEIDRRLRSLVSNSYHFGPELFFAVASSRFYRRLRPKDKLKLVLGSVTGSFFTSLNYFSRRLILK